MPRDRAIIAFCHLRKTGGSSFNSLLRRQFGTRHLDATVRFQPGTRTNQPFYTREHLQQDLLIYPRLRSVSGHYLSPSVDYGETGKRFRWVVFLRDPCRRYVSHYGQHVEKMGVQTGFEQWMDIPQHYNDQVKTLAGKEDLALAKSLLSGMIAGLMEQHDLSTLVVRELLPEFRLEVRGRAHKNPSRGSVDARQLLETHRDRIRENNALDLQLYEYAVEEIWPRQLAQLDLPRLEQELAAENHSRPGTFMEQCRLACCRAKRNLIYKPYLRLRQP